MKLPLLLSLTLGLAACGNQSAIRTEVQSQHSILSEAQTLPVGVSELVAIQSQLMDHTLTPTSLKNIYTSVVEVPDILGNPFLRIVFTTPQPVKDIWNYASTLDKSITSKFQYHFTGASTAREPITGFGDGFNLLTDFYKTRQLLGESKIKRYVALDSNNIVAELVDGQFANARTGEIIYSDTISYYMKNYHDMIQRNSTAMHKIAMEEMWKQPLNTFQKVSKSGDSNNHLDILSFEKELTKNNSDHLITQSNNGMTDYNYCYHTSSNSDDDVCYGYLTGQVAQNTDYNGGFAQGAYEFPSSTASIYQVTNAKSKVIGCTNAAIISMLAWLNKYEGVKLSNSLLGYQSQSSTYTYQNNYYQSYAVQINGIFDFFSKTTGPTGQNSLVTASQSEGMGIFTNGSYDTTGTAPGNAWHARINNWLQVQRTNGMDNLHIVGASTNGWGGSYSSPSDTNYRQYLYNTIINRTGGNKPTIVHLPYIYGGNGDNQNTGLYHSTLLTKYKIYAKETGWPYVDTYFGGDLYISTKDWPNDYSTMTGSWIGNTGFDYIEKQ